MQYAPTRVRAKFGGFHISASGYTKNPPGFTPKPSSQDHFRGVCNTPLHGYMKNLAGFIPKSPSRFFWGRMQYAPTRVRAKFGGFHFSAHDMTRNPAGFGFCHTTWPETRRVLDFATRHSAKPGEFWTLPHDIARNPAGFGLCHST